MRNLLVPALLLLLAFTQVADRPVEAAPESRVRPLTPTMAALLQDALSRSSLVRSQVSALNRSDVIVYLKEAFAAESGEPRAGLRLITAAGDQRYLVVCIDRWMLSWNDRLVLLAHELQHALEIASAPEVRDVVSFRTFYRRVGWELRWGRFETEAACEATARMRSEVQGSRPRQMTSQH